LKTYFALFLIATIASLVTTPLIRRLCQRYNLLDVPLDGRRIHRSAVPRLGGIALYFACVSTLSLLMFWDNLLTQTLSSMKSDILTLLIPATLVLLLGAYDDLRGANAVVKFVGLGLIATLFYAMGGRIDALSIPLFGSLQLPAIVSFVVTVVWLVGIANAFNLIDGLDGLASGAALFSSLVILGVSVSQDRPLTIVVALVLCGALAGFLRYNFNPASIFLGDSGALFIGFLLAALSLLGTQKATTAVAIVVPILAFGFPVVDTAMTMSRRLVSRKPVFEGDNEHIHHMLLARGWSQRRAALVLYGVCALFGLVALIFPATGSKLTGFMLFVISVAVIIAVGHLRYHEVDELRAGVKRTVADRRLRVANNIRVRRAAVALSKALSVEEMFAAVKQLLDSGEFSFASAEVGRPGRRRVYWSWPEENEASAGDWSIRLPLVKDGVDWGWMSFYRGVEGEPLLVDMNYLTDLFRREFTDAAARIFAMQEEPVAAAALAMTAENAR
jgi:UDP-GlcNAc:undecaprenyl-phosphate GlcNAc-1-phosphate transferase